VHRGWTKTREHAEVCLVLLQRLQRGRKRVAFPFVSGSHSRMFTPLET
jgi:hypothetical protein